ncbi:methylaspartate mutase [Streptomyces sp. YH02]|uniref:methylaspartate mutase n=1 Tax=Streptomyces sp. YH02 TaxID=3256999 RepID=UPI0037569D80
MRPAKRPVSFGQFVADSQAEGVLVVQPRMGLSDATQMRAGLLATKRVQTRSAGTITVDSYTRVGDERSALEAIHRKVALNGYPITAHRLETTQELLAGVRDQTFPVQVRHGSARPQHIFAALVLAGLDATEGGPISYCLPYGRTPLADSVRNWRESCEFLSGLRTDAMEPHIETFGGCMLGQLCPPGLLIAISVLEALFFRQCGLKSISLSYAQQTNPEQDEQAVRALRRLATELLPDSEWHIVLYTYMGLFPKSEEGATRLLEESARMAVRTGAARLIVKTTAEAQRIPTVDENVRALEIAAAAAARTSRTYITAAEEVPAADPDSTVYREARALVEAVLNLDDNVGDALLLAFAKGYLDVPYCLHPDNSGRSRSYIDAAGHLMWSDVGAMPISRSVSGGRAARLTATGLFDALSYVQNRMDKTLPAASHSALAG